MESTNYVPIFGLLALAVVVVILLLRFMRPRHPHAARAAPSSVADARPAPPTLSKEDQEYLDSSHILPPGRDPLDTRADDWRNDKRK